MQTYVRKGPYTLYPNEEVVANVIVGLAENLEQHGKMHCPCAPVEESMHKGHEMVCPCTPHAADIARQGYCDCARSSKDASRRSPRRRPSGAA